MWAQEQGVQVGLGLGVFEEGIPEAWSGLFLLTSFTQFLISFLFFSRGSGYQET